MSDGPYPIGSETSERLSKVFETHVLLGEQKERCDLIRTKSKELAFLISCNTPYSREQNLALTKLEESCQHAVSAISRNETHKFTSSGD